MSGNLFKLRQVVDSSFTVEKGITEILYTDTKASTILYNKEKLDWISSESEEYLTLGEILKQITTIENTKEIPIVKVIYESGLWGAIFQVEGELATEVFWYVNGVTIGYA